PGHVRPAVRPFLRSVSLIRRGRYDVAVLSEAPWRAAASVAAARIPARIGLARHRNALFLTHVLPAADVHKSVLAEQARLLHPLGVDLSAPQYKLDPDALGPIREQIAAKLPAKLVAFHPFAGARDRCVPLAEWTQLAFALHGRGETVLWVG